MLDKVVEALRARGVALIEADTDGVYFAVPAGWTEAQERALVAEVAATIPRGLNLEYEGRYRAMFSHEIKNYALLSYSGEMVVRGGALRSSRAEPFGERFLHEALRCTMTGDVAGVRDAFMASVAALRTRALPRADVASRVRLTKRPETYLRTREGHREFAYEALLAAGRDQWRRGERVRCYRGPGGSPVWLPDESRAPSAGTIAESGGGPLDAPASAATGEASAQGARDYDIEHYVRVLKRSYASRLRKGFSPTDFELIFRLDAQLGLFDQPLEQIEPLWIRCPEIEGREGSW